MSIEFLYFCLTLIIKIKAYLQKQAQALLDSTSILFNLLECVTGLDSNTSSVHW